MDISTIHTDDLGQLIDEELDQLTVPHRLYGFLRANGTPQVAAAKMAGFDPLAGTVQLERKTADFRALYAERIARADGYDVGWFRGRLMQQYRESLEKADSTAVLAALKEYGKVAALYPAEPGNVIQSGPVLVQVNLQLPERLVRPSFLPALPPPPVDPLS
jgi:hypothetical protein